MEVRKAVIPSAGWGTRFLPATKAMPKEMFPIIDKPVIQFIVEELLASDIENIVFVTGRHKRPLEHHFDVNTDLEIFLEKNNKKELLENIRTVSHLINPIYIRQKEQLGLGHAVLTAEPVVGAEPFIVSLGDIVIQTDVNIISEMKNLYKKFGKSIVAVYEVPREEVYKYGIVSGKEIEDDIFLIENMVEKPDIETAPSNLAILGRYLFTPTIFEKLKNTKPGKGGEIQLTDAMKMLLEDEAVYAYKVKARVYDTGNKLDYLKTIVEFALQREDLKDEFFGFLEDIVKNNGL
ncbi:MULTISPECIES: UTP--glucose-1-phosphate uridylyltransferase GalU [unclassified Hydrogenobaculum]|uniref:UTP--glucose-1-phosphate uridylyltransferase GalU n=1 Tax=unclassified Hydrogenobaculum TaxID=2622382 RepID=UPI0001C515E4|nr:MULTISPECIES: UTP--glucose-1-phosphate uridylyltransferase GalU [unclassified Hydrogenobaculum]AEF19001.1 UTP-glucose-1-phosphate uridylyltransferase [Hydrogenobaculum sp. 3684]AEG46288.1 UTP-glucose-1-phosphate uridylyltransferase [Hydrogenobaculum sp. SHO]AGG14933.1 UTP-glucose-1-phosphate uridylyltransferase [Hydrogenobaculum sp. HO]AGH93229.1 UTP-glucose-1-phosphate uridylyltransferase [Hydrogenobaculum sp. SN]